MTVCTAGRRPVFKDRDFGDLCVDLLRDLSHKTGVKVFSYCLMPDHVHLLLEATAGFDVVQFVAIWKSKCYLLRRGHGSKDRIWQRSFHDHALRSDEAVRRVAEYIVANPVRAGLVSDARDYPLGGSFEFELW